MVLRSSAQRSQNVRCESVRTQRGFSMIQLVFVLAIVMILSAIALPSFLNITRPLRLRNDANALADLVTMARMRAATQFTQVEIYCTPLASPGTCRLRSLQYGAAPTAWVDEQQNVSLSAGVSFGIPATITTYLPNQSSGTVFQGDSQQYTPLSAANTLNPVVIFNTRGLPIDITGKLNPDYALYLKDQTGRYIAVSINLTGRPSIYTFDNGAFTLMPE